MSLRCVVTAGPTFESMDDVRRLTNFSTGRLGGQLATRLTDQGHDVVLLRGEAATDPTPVRAGQVLPFTSTRSLLERFEALAGTGVHAVFHAAAVSDFTFGRVFSGSPETGLTEVKAGKLSTRSGNLFAELVPTPKVIARLRDLFPDALLVGWKYEVDGDRESVLAQARRQLADCRTDLCVANGPAYGAGFGLVTAETWSQCDGIEALWAALERCIGR